MGVDLILLPIDHERDGWGVSHTVRPLDRTTMQYGNTQHDAYDERLCCATADALWGLRWRPGVMQSARNRAAWAYLGALPPQTRVALYWH